MGAPASTEAVGGGAAGFVPPPGPVPWHIRFGHGFGAVAYGVKDNGFSTFLLLFYNQVIGLPADRVGLVIALALIADAFADVAIGELSDRTRTRWGRRLPWIYGAALPLGAAWIALWHPPELSTAGLFAWLFVMAVLVRTLVSMCEVPSAALVPELTADYHERTVLVRYRFLLGWVGGLILLVLAYRVFLIDGLTERAGYTAYAWAGAAMIIVSVVGSALIQHRRVAHPPPPHSGEVHSVRHIVAMMRETLSHRAFLILVSAALFAFVNNAISLSLTNYLLPYLWRFGAGDMMAYAALLLVSVIVAFVVTMPLTRWLGKRRAALVAGATAILFNAIMYAIYLTGFAPHGANGEPSPWFVFAFVLVSNSAAVVLMMCSASMLTDVVEASQTQTGRRSEGLFMAGYFFVQKCCTGLGILFAGIIVSMAGFPQDAVIGAVPQDVLNRVALYYVLTLVVLGSIGLWRLRKFPISRESHEAAVATVASADRPTL